MSTLNEQQWREYTPPAAKISLHHKMNLRNGLNYGAMLGTPSPVVMVKKDDYGDDQYNMKINDETVSIVARENGQRHHIEGVFDELDSGIFLKVTDKNHRDAESKLVTAFL